MDIEKLTKETILKNMTPEQQKAVLDSVIASVQESKKVRSQKVAENIDLVMQALQKIEAKMLARVDGAASKVEQVAANVKDGRDGKDGKDGKTGPVGPKGADGRNGRDGKDGKDGKDGRDGVDGVSVVDAFLDFDNSLVIELSNGKQINVGAALTDGTADKVKVIANGGGTSQGVLDALAALQAEIDALVKIPSQTGNAGKFLTTNGSSLSWANVAGGLSYQGTWNASTNSPTLTSSIGTNGYYYIVSVAGSTNLDGITDWQPGDWAIYSGTVWQKVDQSWAQAGANSDITSLSGITGGISTADYVTFDTTYNTTLTAGQLGWDGNNTLGLGMAGGNVVQHIGEDQFFYCKASSAITKGQVVMFTGAVGASGVPTGAPATGITDGTYIMGVAAEAIALNGFGLVQAFGTLRNVNTSGFADGDILWYDPAVTGGLTKTKPSAPNVKVQMAAVINGGSSGGGTILIRIDPGSQLGGTDSNAQITSASSGNTLIYDATAGYWKNANISAGTGVSVTNGAGSITIANTAPDQTVALTAGTGITTSGTYPNFTITNSSPDRTVVLTGSGTTTVSGTYPNFTISSSDQYSGTVTSVTAGTGLSGGTITGSGTIALASAYGDTQNPYASKTANYVLAAPNGSNGVPTFRALVAADIPTLNQNTTGTAANVTGVVAEANGGTGTSAGNFMFKNRIINGAMMIDQRNAGASVANINGYCIDRWVSYNAANSFSAQRSTTAPAGFINSLLFTTTTSATPAASDYRYLSQFIEGLNVADLAFGTANATTVTLSFWVRSSLTGTFSGALKNNAENRSYPFTFSISSANTFEYKTITVPGDTGGTWLTDTGIGLRVVFDLGSGSNRRGAAGAWAAANYDGVTGATSLVATNGATFYITGVQLEKGSTATSFDYRPYSTELALCQRYYFKTFNQSVAPAQNAGTNTGEWVTTRVASGSYNHRAAICLPVTMRAQPSVITWYNPYQANAQAYDNDAGAACSSTTQLSYGQGDSKITLYTITPASGGVGNGIAVHMTASAEL